MKFLKTILLLLVFSGVSAQNYVDLARFHYSTSPANDFDSIAGNTTLEDFGLDATLPIVINDNNTFLTGFNLDQLNTKLNPDDNPVTLSTVNLKLGYNKQHAEKWNGTYMFLPKISSDFKKLGSKDYQFGALALMKYSKKENLKYSFGAYYNGELFGPFLVPLIGLYYKSENEKFEANFTLPIWADINYKLNNFMKMGANFAAFVRSYNLGESNAYVVKKSNDIFAYFQFNITKSVLLQTKAGYTIGRSFKAYRNDDKTDLGISAFRFGDNRTLLNPTFADGAVFKVRLIYRFHIE